ncbi:type II secretion system secretin GspD [Persicimonas caeni]|nr:type II secretion system secretin GspD [Persicimonas caeni]
MRRRFQRTFLAVSILVGLAVPSVAAAQDVQGKKPGVIQRGGDQADEEQDQEDNQAQQQRNRRQNQGQQQKPQGQVITPQNVDPNEQYNLPPNFDPNYRPKRTPRSTKVTLDFRQAQLEEVVKFFAAAMNKNFIISDSLQANKTITIISPEEVTLAQAYRAFVAALEMNGLTIVPFGQFSKIVQAKEAISSSIETYSGDERLPGVPRMVTAIVPVENTPPDEMEQIIGKFASQFATIIPYGSSLIITENASNLDRLRKLIKQLDQDEAVQQVYVYEVQYAEATDVQQKLMEIFEAEQGNQQTNRRTRRRNTKAQQAATDGGEGDLNVQISQILADERTNKLIIVANPRDFEKIREMIEILDVPTAVGGQVHVKFLEYADAEEISSTLSNLTSGQNQQQRQRTARARARGGEGVAGQVAALLEGEVQITAYKPNNALVVTASPKDYVALETVIDLLDRPRKQVYVEAVILEIAMDNDMQYGMGVTAVSGQDYDGIIPDSAQESGLIEDTQGGIIGQSNFQGLTSLFGGGLAGSIGLIGPIATIPGTEISLPAFALTLQASQTDRSVNLLSAPAVMTMDNEEAEIVVADRVPFVRGLASGAGGLGGLGALSGLASQAGGQNAAAGLGGLGALGGLGGLISPIEYEDVGITLRILPQINESNFVRLEIDQEVSDIKGASNLGSEIPTRTKRTTKTVVLVEDQSTIVIGGLMKERESKTVTKIPFLGDIPVIGFLFRNTGTTKTKQNLVLMLTPYIIESEADVRKIYERKMEERRELAKLFKIQRKEYTAAVNYQKTSGLIERMRNQLSAAERKAKARQEALEAFENKGPRYQILGEEPQPQPEQQEQPGEQEQEAPAQPQGEPEQQ